jgi:hypothetical protein
MSRTLAGLLREFNVGVVPITQSRTRAARQTCAGKTLAKIFRERGYDHLRSVLMSFCESSRPNKVMLVAPVIWAVSDVLAARPAWFGGEWLTAMDEVNLAELFALASANRRIAPARSAIATLIFDRMRQQFPDAPTKTKRRKRPADQSAARMAA